MDAIRQTAFEGLPLKSRGKVRDIYDLDDHLLIVASDRLSAFDVVLPDPIPRKGEVLTRISAFWFQRMADLVAHHVVSLDPAEYPAAARPYAEALRARSMLVRKARPLPVECIVRGYLAGSGWKEYGQYGSVSSIPLPEGLRESDRLPNPIFTPSTKAEQGLHDENISFDDMVNLIGGEMAERVRDLSIAIYLKGSQEAASHGILIADTKYEFGTIDDKLVLIDELLTPDSSRFWPADRYEPGRGQESFDKQYVRDYLETLDWDKTPPGPRLPDEIIAETSRRYIQIFERLTGEVM